MPRQPRLIVPEIAAHIVQRGNDRRNCFRQDSDHMLYLLHLRELAAKTGCAVHAYCLMTNHVHLLLTPAQPDSCTVLMRDLGQRYVQYFNRRYGRTGTLWEGRFRSCLVESASYVLACHRYIELNPVRAGLARRPEQYAWSSYRSNAGIGEDSLLSPHPEYLALADTAERRRASYARLFAEALDPRLVGAIRDATSSGLPLVTEIRKRTLAARLGRKLERGRPGRRPKSGSEPDLPGNPPLAFGSRPPSQGGGKESGSDPDF
jgi:putative transposase